MDVVAILALAVATYAVLSSKSKEEEDKEYFEGIEASAEKALSEASKVAALVAGDKSDISVDLRLSISSIADDRWNGYVSWHITNSGKRDYYVQDIRSTLVLCGYKIDQWIPGNRNMVLIKPGQTVVVNSSVNDKKFWSSPGIAKIVRNEIKERLGVSVLSSVKFPVPSEDISDLLTVDSTAFVISTPYGNSTNESITHEIPCALAYPAYAKVYEQKGSNSIDWK